MRLYIKNSARKELLRLSDEILLKAFKTILDLRDNPYPRGYDKIEGKSGRCRVWIDRNYRILYEIDAAKKRLDIIAVRLKGEGTYK
jgi:mRNA-degrading endonuclease RelE of RelBE toxin-antitoxin system